MMVNMARTSCDVSPTSHPILLHTISFLLKEEESIMADLGLLIIRVVIGLTFIGHGAQKLFGWFGGIGPSQTGEWLETIGIRPGGKIWAVAAGLFELVGGIFLVTGYLMWLGADMIVVIMLDAIIFVHGRNGFWAANNGYEYNLILIAVCIGLALLGPGTYALSR
jgi:putative oxidoreductase